LLGCYGRFSSKEGQAQVTEVRQPVEAMAAMSAYSPLCASSNVISHSVVRRSDVRDAGRERPQLRKGAWTIPKFAQQCVPPHGRQPHGGSVRIDETYVKIRGRRYCTAPDFVEDYNARFVIIPARPDDLHRPMNLAPGRLTEILCKREQRSAGS